MLPFVLLILATAPVRVANEHVVGLAAPPAGRTVAQSRASFGDRIAPLGLTIVAALADGLPVAGAAGLRRAAARPPFDFDPRRVLLVRAASAGAWRAARERLVRDDAVDWLEPNFVRELADFPADGSPPNDPLLRDTRQWGLWNAGPAGLYAGVARADVQAREAWMVTTGANDLVLALVDTGVDPSHPDLQRVLPDGSLRMAHGANVTADGSRSWADSLAHGTAVAGVMAALTHDGAHFDSLGVAGLCGGDGRDHFGCRLVPIKVTPGRATGASSFDLASGIVWAVAAGARVLNLSFASAGESVLERRALAWALAHDCVAVVAAGNRGVTAPTQPLYPGAFAAEGLCLQVGATDARDRRAAFSSYGPGLDLVAPGQDIWTTAPTYPNAYGARYPGYLAGSGTSFAAPHVAGAAGLLLAVRPELIDTDLQHVLRESAHDIGAPGVDAETGWGRLDVAAALRAVDPSQGLWHDERPAIVRATGRFGTLTFGADSFGTFDRGFRWSGLEAELLEATVTFTLPDSFADSARVWARVVGTTTLRDRFQLAHFAPWAEVAARDGRTVTLRGWLYRVVDGEDVDEWLPLPPDQARIAFTVLGPVDRSTAVHGAAPRAPATPLRASPNPARGACRIVGPPGSRIMWLDLAGRAIRTATLDPIRGEYHWDGRDSNGRRVRPGLYFIVDRGASNDVRPPTSPLRVVVLE